MHRIRLIAVAALSLVFTTAYAQHETSRKVENGGIFVKGWQGSVDARAAGQGESVKDDKFVQEDDVFHVTTGPAVTYWNPSNTASGDYTVSATFTEPHYMNLNDHPHPYGIFIAGNNLGTDKESLLYCEAYGNGRFIVRGFGPEAFQMNGHGEENAAVHKAAGKGEPVTQDVAMSVKGDTVSCSINGTVVASYKKSDVLGEGKLSSTDGVYGIRFAHNTEGTVEGLKVTK